MDHYKNQVKTSVKFLLKTAAVAIAIVLVIIPQTSCASKSAEPVEKQSYYLDTICTISVFDMKGGMTKAKAEKAIDATFDECRRLDKMLSPNGEASDIYRINQAHGAPVQVSEETAKILKSGIKYGELSDGAFDITIGGVTSLWDFHSDSPKVPDPNELASAVAHVDYHNLEVDGTTVVLKDPQAQVDVGGLAKGYISDVVADELENRGVTSAIVNLGGNIVAVGEKPGGKKFNIGIEKPYSERTDLIAETKVANKNVITSGVYERMFKANGKVYHHVLDPKTGYPVVTDLDSATIVGSRGKSMDADALSTICLIKGSTAAKDLIEGMKGYEGLFCTSDGTITMTSGMKAKKVK